MFEQGDGVVDRQTALGDGSPGLAVGGVETADDCQLQRPALRILAPELEVIDRAEERLQDFGVTYRLLGEGRLADEDGFAGRVGAVDPLGNVVGQGTVRDPALRMSLLLDFQALDLCPVEERERSQVLADIPVVGVEPVLVEGEGAGSVRIEPDARARGRLAVLRATLIGQKRVAQGVREILSVAGAELLADQLQTGGHVAPLVGAGSRPPAGACN